MPPPPTLLVHHLCSILSLSFYPALFRAGVGTANYPGHRYILPRIKTENRIITKIKVLNFVTCSLIKEVTMKRTRRFDRKCKLSKNLPGSAFVCKYVSWDTKHFDIRRPIRFCFDITIFLSCNKNGIFTEKSCNYAN